MFWGLFVRTDRYHVFNQFITLSGGEDAPALRQDGLVAELQTNPFKYRTAPYSTAPYQTAPHRTAPHRTAPRQKPNPEGLEK